MLSGQSLHLIISQLRTKYSSSNCPNHVRRTKSKKRIIVRRTVRDIFCEQTGRPLNFKNGLKRETEEWSVFFLSMSVPREKQKSGKFFPNTSAQLRRTLSLIRIAAGQSSAHTPTIALRHLPPNSATIPYATEGAFFISAQLST